jgi:hypothetical protein
MYRHHDHDDDDIDMIEHDEPVSERLPLLATRSISEHELVPTVHSPRMILLILSLVAFLVVFAANLFIMPSERIFEDIICHRYYDNLQGIEHVALDREIDEKMCKVDVIQAELAIVLGGNFVANAVPGMLLSFPWGLLGDRIGRKTVLGLAMLGLTLTQIGIAVIAWFWRTFPLRLIWATPIFQIIGGGGTIPAAMLYATISDISTEENRYIFFAIVLSLRSNTPKVEYVLLLDVLQSAGRISSSIGSFIPDVSQPMDSRVRKYGFIDIRIAVCSLCSGNAAFATRKWHRSTCHPRHVIRSEFIQLAGSRFRP